ncbi:MAG: HD domain-containing protein [Treponema sp.]|jgi:uncharacterized protein|nr:HD domain-containing protein [Treponema sp.]
MSDNELFETITKAICESAVFCQNKLFIQHGAISVYEHSLSVARMSFRLGKKLRIADLHSLVRAALLHDFFLYDWHTRIFSWHGWMHPVYAAENARKYFNISPKEYSLIRTHMWPFTLLHPPQYREGWVICLADKMVSFVETVFRRSKRKSLFKIDNVQLYKNEDF